MKFKDMVIGKVLCDMHDGLDLPEGCSLVRKITVEGPGGAAFIDSVLTHNEVPYAYTNKYLVVLGETSEARKFEDDIVVAAYSYDDLRLVFMHIRVDEGA